MGLSAFSAQEVVLSLDVTLLLNLKNHFGPKAQLKPDLNRQYYWRVQINSHCIGQIMADFCFPARSNRPEIETLHFSHLTSLASPGVATLVRRFIVPQAITSFELAHGCSPAWLSPPSHLAKWLTATRRILLFLSRVQGLVYKIAAL